MQIHMQLNLYSQRKSETVKSDQLNCVILKLMGAQTVCTYQEISWEKGLHKFQVLDH